MARPTYSPARVETLQREIVAATLLVVRREGYQGVSLRAIAREVGWTPAALYRYFPSKDALIAAIRAEGFERMEGVLDSARAQAADPLDAIRAAMRGYLEFALEEPEVFRLMYDLVQSDGSSTPMVRAARKRAFAVARAIATDAVEAGLLEGEPNLLAHLYWVNAHGLASLELAQQLDLGCSLDELAEPLLQRLTAPTGGRTRPARRDRQPRPKRGRA